MNPHEILTSEHEALRKQAYILRETIEKNPEKISDVLAGFQQAVQHHFKGEEAYYRILDDGKRIDDRGMMHQLRNDHAAVIFTLESLVIRLRKNGPNADWRARFEHMMDVLLPHLDHEDSKLFPMGQKTLSPQESASILQHLQNRE